jgi:hypothetical protein
MFRFHPRTGLPVVEFAMHEASQVWGKGFSRIDSTITVPLPPRILRVRFGGAQGEPDNGTRPFRPVRSRYPQAELAFVT